MAIFAASIVLLLNIWGGRQAGIVNDANREMAQVHKCMRILKAVEDRYVQNQLEGFRPLSSISTLQVFNRRSLLVRDSLGLLTQMFMTITYLGISFTSWHASVTFHCQGRVPRHGTSVAVIRTNLTRDPPPMTLPHQLLPL
jgi:hypothetical protein